MSTTDPGATNSATIIHHARKVPGPTTCGASGTPCPTAIEWRLVTCPACMALAPAAEQAKPRSAKPTLVGRPLVMSHKPGCAALADPPAACNCG